MTEWCWLNGRVMPLAEAMIGVEDRGFQFADGVYEAVRLYNGRPFELPAHLARLERSCVGIRMAMPMETQRLAAEMLQLVGQAGVRDGFIYLQITRGSFARNHLFPKRFEPTVLFYIRPLPPLSPLEQTRPYSLLSVPDERWNKCWIKSIALLANVLARNDAADAGADEAIFIHDANVTEGSSSNLFMVEKGTLITHPLGPKILPGITRDVLLDCARQIGITIEERAMKLEEAKAADEIFITSSTRELVWVNRWDDAPVGGAACGPITRRLHEQYKRRVAAATT